MGRHKKYTIKNKLVYYKWCSMKNRCENPKHKVYRNYGGRGIIVCDRWQNYENFESDMLESYLKHVAKYGTKNTTLDRIDVNGNYEPSNCRWATWKEQANNRRNNVMVTDELTLAEFSELHKISVNVVKNCLIKDLDLNDTIKTEHSNIRHRLPCGKSLFQHCKENHYVYDVVIRYISKQNLPADKALALYLERRGRTHIKAHYTYFLPCGKPLKEHCNQNKYNYEAVRYYIRKYNLEPHEALAKYLSKFGKTKYWLSCDISLKEYCIKNNYAYSTILKYIKKYNLEPKEALARYLKNKQKST